MQNSQSNGLIAGLLLLAFGLQEKNKPFWAIFCIVLSMYIKLFGIVGFSIFLFYPKKWKSALYALFWILLLFLLPLIFVDFEYYMYLFKSYLGLLTNDHDASFGYSVMGWIHSWWSVDVNKNMIVAIGILIFLIPYYRLKMYRSFNFKLLSICSILIWIVIFNHKAESPTFIIAMTGVALWFVHGKKSLVNTILFLSAFILTSLSPTDLFPKFLRDEYVTPYLLKSFPCIVIWVKIIYDMLTLKQEERARFVS